MESWEKELENEILNKSKKIIVKKKSNFFLFSLKKMKNLDILLLNILKLKVTKNQLEMNLSLVQL
jgi:hypothetical protein